MTALPSWSQYPLKINKISKLRQKQMQILSANFGVQIKPVFHLQTREIGQILARKSKCAQKSTVNKTRIGFRIGLRIGSDFGSDRIGLRIGLDRIGICRIIIFLEKAVLRMTQADGIFGFRAACVSNKKNCFSCITSLKIHHQLENHRKELFSSKLHGEIFCCINS